MSFSPFDHPFLSGLFGDPEIAELFSVEADIAAMLRFEIALAEALGDGEVAAKLARFEPDVEALRAGIAKDGVVVPELVRQMRVFAGERVHFGATSQDVIDTSLVLRLKAVMQVFGARLRGCVEALERVAARDGARGLMSYTRMQAAIPITVADRVRAWVAPLERYRAKVEVMEFPVQFGGAVGTLEKLGSEGNAVHAALARQLDLTDRPQWHSQRDWIAEFAGLLSLITGSLGKLGQDIALLAERGNEIELVGGGASSAMPHKQNPVGAELLVTLARFNAGQLSLVHQALIHEQERSGSAWMLEWLTLPQMVAATGSALLTGEQLANQIKKLGKGSEGIEK